MKVALFANHFPPEFTGGTEMVVAALAQGLQASGEEVVVVCATDQPLTDAPLLRDMVDGIPVLRLPKASDEHYHLRVARPRLLDVVRQTLQDERIEVVHLHHWAHLSDGLLQLAAEVGVARLATLHDMWSHCPRFFRLPPPDAGIECPVGSERTPCVACCNLELNMDPDPLHTLLVDRDRNLREELNAAQHLTAPSQSCAAAAEGHIAGLRHQVEVVPHGLLHAAIGRHDQPATPLRIGSFGNQGREKGTAELLAAVGRAKASGVDLPLHLYGGFPDEGFQQQLQARAAELQVELHLHGRYDATSAHPALQMDLAVFFSHCEETYGLVVDEALAHGVPALVSDRGAMPERVARGGGQVIAAGDVEALAQAIQTLATEPSVWSALRDSIPPQFPMVNDAVVRYREIYAQLLRAAP